MTTQVVIAGGGVGALEGLLALQSLASDRVSIRVITASRTLTYRALATAEPFGGMPAPRLSWREIARDRGVRLLENALVGVRSKDQEIVTRDGEIVRYDALLLALGARPQAAFSGALTFSGPADVAAFAGALGALEPGRRHRIAFVASEESTWTLPLYELALLTAGHGRLKGLDLAVELVTREAAPLEIFGRASSEAVARLLAGAGIHLRTASFATEVCDGNLWLELEGPLRVDLVVALPRLRGPKVFGLPHDDKGFVPVDSFCRVSGVPHVWAVGDMTTRPLKQGGLAAQQADVAAAGIAATAGEAIEVRPYEPSLRGVLFAGAPQLPDRPSLSAGPAETGRDRPSPPAAAKVWGRHITSYLDRADARTSAGAVPD